MLTFAGRRGIGASLLLETVQEQHGQPANHPAHHVSVATPRALLKQRTPRKEEGVFYLLKEHILGVLKFGIWRQTAEPPSRAELLRYHGTLQSF